MYIIAEIGSNYNSIDDCLLQIELAKKCGADAVKFQHFTYKEMYGQGKGEMTPGVWLYSLYRHAKQNQLGFSCTFFSPGKLEQYLHMLDFIKIASSNMMDTRLLDIAKASGKKTLISTGGHELYEVNRVYEYFPAAAFMYCESVYPSHVNNYKKMKDFFFEGVSDHSKEVYPEYPNCKYVEKHVNLLDLRDKPDSNHALGFYEFSKFCKHVKGNDNYHPLLSIEEADMRALYNVRLVAKKDIGEGCVLDWENVGIYRGVKPSQNYISPMDADKVIGKVAVKEIKAWSAIGNSDFQAAQLEAESVPV